MKSTDKLEVLNTGYMCTVIFEISKLLLFHDKHLFPSHLHV